jgi:hypothetical protein
MKKFLIVTILCLLLAACQSAQPSQQPQVQSSEVAPSAQAPSNQGSANLCDNPYLPVVEGATWSYNLTTSSGSKISTDTITDVGNDAFLVETNQASLNFVVTWSCTPEGLNWLQSDGGMFSAVFQSGGTVETLSSSGVFLPANVQPGDTWTTTEEIHVVGLGLDETFTVTAAFNAVGMETVTVPAGTFNALRIDITMSNSSQTLPVTLEGSSWVVEGIGQVKNVANNPSFDLEMTSFSIP